MKKQLLILTTAILSLSGFAQVPNYVPTTGLVGWWPFNGNPNDESGNGNNGSVNGAALISDRNGQSSSAYNFDVNNWSFGSGGDNIYIPYNLSFNFTDFTISTWVKRTSAGSTISPQSLSIIKRFQYGYNNPNGESWVLEVAHGTNSSGAVLYGAVIEQSPSPAYSFYSQSNQTVPLNQWCNIIMTYSQNTINLYINNQLVGTASDPTVTINTVGNSGISIGLSEQANGQWSPFDGSIDDIGIWNRALTACEIQDLYHSQLGYTTVNAGTNQTVCNGDTISLTATGATTYTWDNNVINGQPFAPISTQDYIVTGTDSLGCTGTDTVSVVVLEPSSATQTESALDSYTWPLNNQVYSQSGTYTDTIPNAAGCDSIVILNLTLNYTGIHELNQSKLVISPNPTKDIFTITGLEQLGTTTSLELKDANGKVVKTLDPKATEFKITDLKAGIYFLKITAGTTHEVIKLIKE